MLARHYWFGGGVGRVAAGGHRLTLLPPVVGVLLYRRGTRQQSGGVGVLGVGEQLACSTT